MGDRGDRVRGGLWGLVVGDALGVPVQFRPRAAVRANPVEGMRALGDLPPGTWSDDGSMALQLAASLAERGYDPHDIMEGFWRWYENGEMTPFGEAWDIGGRTRETMETYRSRRPELGCGGAEERDNGNGSLMRNLPLAVFLDGEAVDVVVSRSFEVSALTHAHVRSKLCCAYHSLLVRGLLRGSPIERAMRSASEMLEPYVPDEERPVLDPVLDGSILDLPRDEIESTGYVVHTLGASLWCLARHDHYADAVLEAVNLGGDADTTGAVAGGLTGVRGGVGEVPRDWIEKIQAAHQVETVVNRFVGSIER